MKTLFTLVLCTTAYALSPNASEGKNLYVEENCKNCHNLGENFDHKKRKANNFKSLGMWVKTCDSFYETGWFPDEQNKVIKYLNETHYDFLEK